MSGGWFVTGTDTGVGKTLVTGALLLRLAETGARAVGMKPVASGCETTDRGLRNEDAEILLRCGNVDVAYEDVNPLAFAAPIAPHIAAARAGSSIELPYLQERFAALYGVASHVVVEGIGGWAVPLSERETMADLARVIALPVVVVVGLRLGCLNHALLTTAAVRAAGLELAGWVANQLDPAMDALEANVTALTQRIPAPLLGRIPVLPSPTPEAAGRLLNLPG